MKKANVLHPYALLVLSLAVLSGCKLIDDRIEEEGANFAGLRSNGSAPAIWGDPQANVLAGSQYLFLPEASDTDGDVLTFSIVNRPEWADFDAASGQLRGLPRSDDVGDYRDIVISVTDENSVVSLPGFSISVTATPVQSDNDGGEPASAPPTIAGSPNKSAVVGDTYTFQPESSDPDGDTLSFSIINKPSWVSFDTATGRLKGMPTSSHLGESNPIELSVTDGTSIAGLTPFTITVEAAGPSSYTISWVAPTENEDGTPLTDLAGYRIYYGTAPGDYTRTIEINSPGVTSYMIGNLTPGTYYLVMTSVNSRDMESRHSSELEFEPTT